MIARGEIWWADFDAPAGSGPGFRRPVVVVQSDAFNRSRKKLGRERLTDRVGRLSNAKLQLIIDGIELVLGR